MSHNKPTIEPDSFESEPFAESASGAAAETGSNPGSEESKLAEVTRERDELRDKFLRSQAECANIAKRLSQQHRLDIQQAPRSLAKSMLTVLDGLERTIKSLEEAGRDDPIAEGVRLLREQFLAALRENQIEPIESIGKPFNPELHEALMQDPKSELPAGTVAVEFERGYTLHGRVIRHAKVVVSARPAEGASGGDGDETGN